MDETGVEDNHLIPYDGNYSTTDNNDEHMSSVAMWYPCPFFNPIAAQEEFLHGFTYASRGTEEADYSISPWNDENELDEETYEGEEFPYYSCGNWFSEYEHSFGNCWGDGYFSLANGTHNNEGGRELEIEDSMQSEQQHESHLRHEEDTQVYHPTCDSNPWYDLWLACGGKTQSHDYSGQETRVTSSYGMPEIGVCESIFGYWPCLYR